MAQHAGWAWRVWREWQARVHLPTGGRHDTPTPADAHPLPSTAPSPTPLNTSCQASYSLETAPCPSILEALLVMEKP